MKFRIDFGRVFPGLVMFFVGLVLLVVMAIVAIVAFLFSFVAGAGGVLGAVLELMLIPTLLIAAGIITTVTGVSWWGTGSGGWFSGFGRRRALQDRMRISQRIGEVVGVAIALIIFFFLYENQMRGVEFFTANFGSLAQFFFYAPLLVGVVLSFSKAVYGRRNGIRPFEAINALFLAVAAFWLLNAWPFDFTHFGDMFPNSIQFLFGWLQNWMGQALFTLAGVGSLINFFYTSVLYASVRGQLAMRGSPLKVGQ